jgi:hypothetical protein
MRRPAKATKANRNSVKGLLGENQENQCFYRALETTVSTKPPSQQRSRQRQSPAGCGPQHRKVYDSLHPTDHSTSFSMPGMRDTWKDFAMSLDTQVKVCVGFVKILKAGTSTRETISKWPKWPFDAEMDFGWHKSV